MWWNVRHFGIVAVSYCQLDFQRWDESPLFHACSWARSTIIQFIKCCVCIWKTVLCYCSTCQWWKMQLIHALTDIPPWLAAAEVLKNISSPPLASGSGSSDGRSLSLKHTCNCTQHTVWYAVTLKYTALPELPWATCFHSVHVRTSDNTHAHSRFILHWDRFPLLLTFKVQLRMALRSVLQSRRKKSVTESDLKEERDREREEVWESDS